MVNSQTGSLYREILHWLQLLAGPQETSATTIFQLHQVVITLLKYPCGVKEKHPLPLGSMSCREMQKEVLGLFCQWRVWLCKAIAVSSWMLNGKKKALCAFISAKGAYYIFSKAFMQCSNLAVRKKACDVDLSGVQRVLSTYLRKTRVKLSGGQNAHKTDHVMWRSPIWVWPVHLFPFTSLLSPNLFYKEWKKLWGALQWKNDALSYMLTMTMLTCWCDAGITGITGFPLEKFTWTASHVGKQLGNSEIIL